MISVDTETEEFDEEKGVTPRNAKLIGVSVGYDKDWAEYETDEKKWQGLIANEPTIVYHNARFDILKLKQSGITIPDEFEDTLIAAHLINENTPHGLKYLASSVLGHESVKYTDVDKTDASAFAEYAKNDAKWTYELWERYKTELHQQDLLKVYDLEKRLVPVIHGMESAGMMIDSDKLSIFKAEVDAEHIVRKRNVFDVAGIEFEINSPKQVGEFLYDTLQLTCQKITKSGANSTNREALIALKHPIADAILKYREVDKIRNAFSNKYGKYVESDSRVRASYNPLGTATGRFSCSAPNQQQISSKSTLGKQFRNCFVAAPGKKLVIADWSQFELRILAHYSEDPLLLEAYKNGADLHKQTAMNVFNTKSPTADQRQVSKTINFGTVYGLSPYGLFQRLPGLGINGVSENQCAQFINKYFQTYRGIKYFLSAVERTIRTRGYVKTLYGRRRRLKVFSNREVRQAQNMVIQGTAADLCKEALIGIYNDLPADSAITGVIHDEIIVETPEDTAPLVEEIMTAHMQRAPANFRVPLEIDCRIVDCWGEGK
jgi:DNA polymerase-1